MSTIIEDMHIQIVSDLHLEKNPDNDPDPFKYIDRAGNILVMAGDIGSLYKIDQFRNFIKRTSKLFKYILFTLGNHEMYTCRGYRSLDAFTLLDRLKKLEEEIPNFFWLNRSFVILNNSVCIAGCTLWSKLDSSIDEQKFKKVNRIYGMTKHNYHTLHLLDLFFVAKMIQYCQKKKLKLILVSHYPPSNICQKDEDYWVARNRSLYGNSLDKLLHRKFVHTWIFGHTHYNFDFYTITKTRLVCNQRGKDPYVVEDYKKSFLV